MAPQSFRSRHAFTLIEMSVVLIVIGLVSMIVFPALGTLRSDMAQRATRENLNGLLRATEAFVQANGCLPCPTPAAKSGSVFGHLRGDSLSTACAGCSNPEGLAPFVALGVPMSMAKDGWGRWITMRVDPALTNAFTPLLPSGNAGFCASGLDSSNRITVRAPGQTPSAGVQAAVIFVSHGADGYGAFQANATNMTVNGTQLAFPSSMPACGTTQGYARCNASQTTDFVDSTPLRSDTDPFDDSVIFLGRNALVAAFGTTACTTPW